MLDVIIPAYNASDTLDRALRSLAMQTIANQLHVTVVDDCSTESYDHIIKRHEFSFRQLTHIRLDQNGGSGVARRIAVENTTQPYIAFLDADDMYYDVQSLERLLIEMEKNPNCIVATGDFLEQGENGGYNVHPNDLVWCFSKIYRRSFLEKHGINFNDTRCNEDVGMNTKIVLMKDESDIFIAVNQPTYIWCFNHRGITKVNKFAYAFSNGIAGYVSNKIEAFEFSGVEPMGHPQAYAVLVQLYKVYTQACYVRPEYVPHIMTQAKRFTDFMFKEPINEIDLMNGVMPCKADFDKIAYFPVLTLFDFVQKLGVTIEKNSGIDSMAYAKRIEVTTLIGCPIGCNSCPQDILCERYDSPYTMLSLDVFKEMLKTVPEDYMICFAGYAEPFLNPRCADMILYAHDKGHRVGLYTCLEGMTMSDWDRIKHIPFYPLVLHLPTPEGGERINVTENYLKLMDAMKPHNYSVHGTLSDVLKKHMYNAYIQGPDQIHDRAGLLEDAARKVERKGSIFCITDMMHPVLVPNGDLYVCCQDFGLEHKVGNLLETPFPEIMDGEPIKELKRKLQDGEETMCHKCVMSREIN